MVMPPVKVEVLDSKVHIVAQRLCEQLLETKFKSGIEEISLLCSLLEQCGGTFYYENYGKD